MRPKRHRIASIASRTPLICSPIAAPPKTVNPHYLTAEHRAWREGVLKRAGYCCQSCGRNKCRLFADHIVELPEEGDALDPANGQALCGSCHTAKTSASRARRGGSNP